MQTVLIDPAIVHKSQSNDVLLINPRAALPITLPCEARDIAAQTDLAPLYREEGDVNVIDIPDRARTGIALAERLRKADPDYAAWQASRGVSFQVVNSEASLEALSEAVRHLWDQVPEVVRASSYEMINTADNYYFYSKPHEHVPGVMLIEAARQACYYHSYSVLTVPKGEVTMTVDELNSRFFAYAELMYPIELVVDEIKTHEPDNPNRLFLRTSLYQRGKLFAVVDSKLHVIDMSTFQKIRNIFLFSSDWYRPIAPGRVSATLRDAKGQVYTVDLLGVSKTGCITSTAPVNASRICAIRIEGGGSIEVDARTICAEGSTLKLKFDGLKADAILALGEIIKRSFVQFHSTPETRLVDAAC